MEKMVAIKITQNLENVMTCHYSDRCGPMPLLCGEGVSFNTLPIIPKFFPKHSAATLMSGLMYLSPGLHFIHYLIS